MYNSPPDHFTPFMGMTANHIHLQIPLRIFIALLPQVSLSFINNTAQVGSALYLQYIEQCSYFGLEESSHSLREVFRSDQFQYRLGLLCTYVTYVHMYVLTYIQYVRMYTCTYV